MLYNIGLDKEFMATTSEVYTTQAKWEKWDYIKLKVSFCTAKVTINSKKSTCGMGENIYKPYVQ